MNMDKYNLYKPLRVAWLTIALICYNALADANNDMDAVFARDQAPAGVIFEIVDWDDEYLKIAIPWVNAQIIALREKFPGLDIAVVSHGSEQFALLKDANAAYPEIHSNVQRLISDHDVKLELCLGHANMRGFNQEDFPDYVAIEASGPSQIAAYESLGYDKVVVTIE
jgi:hypothetical protein